MSRKGIEKNSEKVTEMLFRLLASTFTIYLKLLNYHWNVTGEQFLNLHQYFEKEYNLFLSAIDKIAERIRALGKIAPASYTEFMNLTIIKEETQIKNSNEMLSQLLQDHQKICQFIANSISFVENEKDIVTQDLLTERTEEHEKAIWMLKSMIN